jgi:hypothetical protein
MAEKTPVSVNSCKICDTGLGKAVSPRRLPCGHIFCEACIVGKLLVPSDEDCECAVCGEKMDKSLDVAALEADYGADYSCTKCKKNGHASLALMYCSLCKQSMCGNHLKVSEMTTPVSNNSPILIN